jgi:hypothetical protein
MAMKIPFLHFKGIQYGIKTILSGLIPVTLAIICFEMLIDVDPYQKELRTLLLAKSYNFKMLIYYIVAGFAHIVICSIIIYHFFLTGRKNAPEITLKWTRRIRFICLLSMFAIVFVLDAVHINIAVFSHDRLYILMSQSPFFKSAMKFFPGDFLAMFQYKWFHIFSVYPFILICFALTVMVYGGFYIGKDLHGYINRSDIPNNEIKKYISDINSMLKKYAQLLSVVLVSSTISTVLFFQVPVSLLKEQAIKTDYCGVSVSMGICWGVIFSLTLLFLCMYPYWLTHKKITMLIQDKRVQDDLKLEEWLNINQSFYLLMGNTKLIVSVICPAAASIIATMITQGL